MRIQCASKMPKKCAYLNAFQKRIKCASEIRNQKILSYAFQMRFRCISKMLKRFDAKLETFQMRLVFTGMSWLNHNRELELCPSCEFRVSFLNFDYHFNPTI